jgi:GT2 family glycosyltransferase
VRIILNETNSGFSATANRGIKNSKYDLVLLLNNDVKLESDYFIHQLKYFESDDTFGVMGRISGWDNDMIQDGAKYPLFHGVKIKTSGNYILKDEKEMRQGLYSMYLSGANALINKKIFLAIGGFNEIFSPFYVEDYELSLRAGRFGYKCYYEHRAVCHHKASATIKKKIRKLLVEKIYDRNKMYLHAIHLSATRRYLYFFQLIPESMARLLTGRLTYIQSVFMFVNTYGRVRKSRKDLEQKASGRNLLSVNEVADTILNSIKNKSTIKI